MCRHRLLVARMSLGAIAAFVIPGFSLAAGLPNPFFVMDTAFVDTLTGREPVILKLRFLAETAKANGLKLALYPHTARWTARFGDATKLAKVVNHPSCGVTFNLCHCLATGDEEKIPALLEEARSVLFLVTINGVDSCRNGPVPVTRFVQRLDQGTFDVGIVLRKLRKIDYTGPIGFQGASVPGSVRSILASTREAWKKLSAATN